MSTQYKTMPTSTALDHKRHRLTGAYMYSIGITGARWKTTSYPVRYSDMTVQEVTFKGIDSEKAKFIFELKGGVNALNEYLAKEMENVLNELA